MSKISLQQQLKNLYQQCDHCMLSDRPRFLGQIKKLRQRTGKQQPDQQAIAELSARIEASVALAEQRLASVPPITYPEELPVSQKKDDILQALAANQVIIVCGETGSGKTTQLPKICLQLGLGSRGLIGHTQPRRLAASSVASRIAEELNTELGQLVGYKVRFTDRLGPSSHIKLMTDGILLAEIHHDPWLNQYDAIIIDEAHERSLNIDFLLGYLKRLLPRRPDLKIIITSATIDPQRFSRHFSQAPVIEVSGRSYPVEVHYHPLHGEDDDERQRDLQQGISDAVDELSRLGRGDILVFLSGERDIRETADYLNKRQLSNTEILPLLARLSAAEQNKIFHTSAKRRIVLATNIAETSLTVPGIKYVIDCGVARISRYSWRSKMQRLPIEKISQASANQRKGRCGRVSAGVCIRLYSEDDFNQRAEFTEPEIQRTNLASVILQMENMQLGHVEDFPFVEPPDDRLVKDGYKLLFELGAINHKHKITPTGKKLARLPIDPKLGRMLLEAEKESVLSEVLIITSALAIQDPRERPMDRQQAADEAHKKFQDNRSDFLGYLNIWNQYHQQQEKLSGNKLRQWCKQNFLSWLRIREWRDSHRQIKHMLSDLGLRFNHYNSDQLDYAGIHRALLTGLLGNLGFKDEEKGYIGARNRKFSIFPGSALFNKNPKWLMAAEIVETNRVYARTVAKIDVEWIEQKAQHLIKRSYSNAHWEKRAAQVSAFERSSLYGLIINPKRKINYGPINPEETHETFIRSALVQGDFNCRAEFFTRNQALIAELENLEAKSRRQDILVDDETLYQFYASRIPENIYSGPQFHQWLKSLGKEQQQSLLLTRDDLMQHDAADITSQQFPDQLNINDTLYPLEYHFSPDHQRDGITLITPLAGLQAINAQYCEWLVPGMLHEKMVALIRSLPKQLRRNFVPAPNFADACLHSLEASEQPLTSAMSAHLKKITGTEIPYDAWRPELLDNHLFMNFRVIGNDGKTLAESRHLQQLKDDYANYKDSTEQVKKAVSIEQDEVDASILGSIPDNIDIETHGVKIKHFPALHCEGKTVALRCFTSRQEAQDSHHLGMRQLFINALPEQLRYLKRNLPNIQQLCLQYASLGKCDELKDDIIAVTVDQLFNTGEILDQASFEQHLQQGRDKLLETASGYCGLLGEILGIYAGIRKILKKPSLGWLDIMADIQEQMQNLLQPHFILHTQRQWLEQYPRYLTAIMKRLEKIQDNPDRDRKNRLAFNSLWQAYTRRAESLEKQHLQSDQLDYYRWMLEEYRVSLFAQELKTLFPVSEKRLQSYWKDINDS